MSRVGKDIDSLCTKCKMVLNHVVVSEIGNVASKVQCRTCGTIHNYRDASGRTVRTPRERSSARLVRVKAPAGARTSPREEERLWQMRKAAMPEDVEIFDYQPGDNYLVGDVVQHAQFGLGFVERRVDRTRVEILFQSGLKLMVMNTPPPTSGQ